MLITCNKLKKKHKINQIWTLTTKNLSTKRGNIESTYNSKIQGNLPLKCIKVLGIWRKEVQLPFLVEEGSVVKEGREELASEARSTERVR